jgi:sugar lactone lactonase YvrE
MRFVRVALGLLLLSISAAAQQYVISTVAGGVPPPTPILGVDLATTPYGVATDAVGNVYFTSDNCVFKLDQTGIVTRVAGNSRRGYSGDGGLATSAQLNYPIGVAVDGAGNMFFADALNFRIRKVSQSGIITTVAGSGTQGYSGDDGPATSAQLGYPQGVALDAAGNLFIADSANGRVRKVSPSGIIITVAGNNAPGSSGDGAPATSAQVSPAGVVVDRAGNLFISDPFNARVRMVSSRGIITTVAGNGTRGISGDGGPATSAQLYAPQGVAVDEAGNLFIADSGNGRLRKVSPSGIITTVAGGGKNVPGDGGPAISAQFDASGVAVDRAGNLFLSDLGYQSIRKVSPDGIITKVAGNGRSTFYGTFSGDGGPAVSAQLAYPTGVAVDAAGNLFIAESGRIRKVSSSGIISTVAGNGVSGFSGDGGPATSAQLNMPEGVAVDGAGNLFIADVDNSRIRLVSADGTITTAAGNGTWGFSGDGGPATSAALSFPEGVAVDRAGNVYIADGENHAVRVLRPTNLPVLIGAVVDAASQSATPVLRARLLSFMGLASVLRSWSRISPATTDSVPRLPERRSSLMESQRRFCTHRPPKLPRSCPMPSAARRPRSRLRTKGRHPRPLLFQLLPQRRVSSR